MPEDASQWELIASRMLAGNALAALRGPMSRGAVPAANLAESVARPRNTVTRAVARTLEDEDGVPFDLAARRALDLDRNGHQQLWENALKGYIQDATAFRAGLGNDELSVLRKVVATMLESSFSEQANSEFRLTLLNGYLLVAAAIAADPATIDDTTAGSRERIIELRRLGLQRSTALYANALRQILRGSSRRPRPGYSEEDVVVALHSLFDGHMLRHLLDPTAYPLALLVDALWDLAVAMTEPGFLNEAEGEHGSLRADLLRAALAEVRAGRGMPTVLRSAELAGVDAEVAEALFPDTTRLADNCLDFALAGTAELRELAANVRGGGLTTLAELMRVIAEVTDTYRPLVDTLDDARAWYEMRALAARMLDGAGDAIVPVDTAAAADILVRAAVRGGAGEQEWRAALAMLTAPARTVP
ncbi:MAG TPA: hypothetical protein VGS21_09910 [Acidimicrobiales bacterium]|nr:hypothetical protein [Acidimicrobiales bacterium]